MAWLPTRPARLRAPSAPLLCAVALAASGMTAIGALGLTSFFMSVMFPTIFSLGVAELGERTKLGSSLLVMAIIGGALFPPLTGFIGEQAGSLQIAMVAPLGCFIVVALFGRYMHRWLSERNA